MNLLPAKAVPLLIVLFFLTVLAAPAYSATYEGTVSVTKRDEGKVVSITLASHNGKADVTYRIVVDSISEKMADVHGMKVQVSGSLASKKGEKLLKVKSFFLVLVGRAEAERTEKKKLTGIRFNASNPDATHNVMLDSMGKKLIVRTADKTLMVLGSIVQNDKGRWLQVKSFIILRQFEGTVQVVKDKKGRLKGIRLQVVQGKRKSTYGIVLDANGRQLENLADTPTTFYGVKSGSYIKVVSFG
jgi:hypothetical protein